LLLNSKIRNLIEINKKEIIINENFIEIFLSKLGNNEEIILRNNYLKGKKRMSCEGDEYQKEIFKIENLQFKINDPIKLGYDQPELWRKRYYKYYWDVEDDEIESFSKNLVLNYLKGLKWVSCYYFESCPSWEWYYPYDQPPLMSDISRYIKDININKIKFELGKPIKPFMQLLAVLPPQSSFLLPDNFRKLVLNPKSSIAYMYPLEFEQDFINKHKYWMGIPKLPPLDLNLLKHSYYKYENEINDIDKKRNNLKLININKIC